MATIHSAKDKRAGTLAAELDDRQDGYQEHIKAGAQAMVKAGYPQAVYITQWGTGATVWDIGTATNPVVHPDGKIDW